MARLTFSTPWTMFRRVGRTRQPRLRRRGQMHIQNFNLMAGEDRTLTMRATTQAGAVLNLAGASILWRLSQSQGGTAVLEEAGSIVSASAGTFSVTLSDDETDGLQGAYIHQALVTISGTTTVATMGRVLVGSLNQPVFN